MGGSLGAGASCARPCADVEGYPPIPRLPLGCVPAPSFLRCPPCFSSLPPTLAPHILALHLHTPLPHAAAQDLVELVEDPAARAEKLGTEELDWPKMEAYFGGRRCVVGWAGRGGGMLSE